MFCLPRGAKKGTSILPITNYHISVDSEGFYISRVFLEFSPKPVYSIMVAEKFQIYNIKTPVNTFVSQIICSILLIPPSKTILQVLIIIPKADEICPFLMELKKFPKLTRALVTGFDKFHHLCNLYIFGLCFVVQ